MLDRQLCDFKGIRTSIAKEPYIFVIYQVGGPDPLSPPLDPPMMLQLVIRVYVSVDESSSSVFQFVYISVVFVLVWLPDNVLVFKAWACHSEPYPLGVCAPHDI